MKFKTKLARAKQKIKILKETHEDLFSTNKENVTFRSFHHFILTLRYIC